MLELQILGVRVSKIRGNHGVRVTYIVRQTCDRTLNHDQISMYWSTFLDGNWMTIITHHMNWTGGATEIELPKPSACSWPSYEDVENVDPATAEFLTQRECDQIRQRPQTITNHHL